MHAPLASKEKNQHISFIQAIETNFKLQTNILGSKDIGSITLR
jgi:hypothetical protein